MANEKRLIDANALLERENEAYLIARQHPSGAAMFAIIHRTLQDLLKQAPTVDAVEVKHGRWIPKLESVWNLECPVLCGCTCSVCNTTWDAETNYCPNCGADMR